MTAHVLHDAATTAYDLLAPFYDAYTEHPDYARWVRRLERLARDHGLSGRRALDVGCGTGKSVAPLLELGYDVVGCDPSEAMLRAAEAKLAHRRARLLRRALPELGSIGRFDYVTCLNDVLNYLEPDALAPALDALAGNLRRGGVLVFDTSTTALYRELFARDHVRRRGGHVFAWSAATPLELPAGAQARAWLDVFTPAPAGGYARLGAEQLQRHHPEEAVGAAIERAGLRLSGRFGQLDDGLPVQPLDLHRHTKCVWVVRKP